MALAFGNCQLLVDIFLLPTARARCTMKSDRRRHPQATRRQRGRAVTRRVTDQEIASHRASREPAILIRRPCHHCSFTASASTLHQHTRPCDTTKSETPGSRIAASTILRGWPTKAQTLETPLGRCCHTDPAKHHPSSGTTEKG